MPASRTRSAPAPSQRPASPDPASGVGPAPDDGLASRRHLFGRIAVVDRHVRAAVARRRDTDEQPDDPWRGLYISDDKADRLAASGVDDGLVGGLVGWPGDDGPGHSSVGPGHSSVGPGHSSDGPGHSSDGEDATELLEAVEAMADEAEAGGHRVRLRELQRRFGLDGRELDLLLVALAPELDRRFEQLYGYLNDDVTRRRATVALAMELCDVPLASAAARAVVGPASRLVRQGLVAVEADERPWPGRELRVPDRVAAWCTGHDEADLEVDGVVEPGQWPVVGDGVALAAVGRWLQQDGGVLYVREAPGASGRSLGEAAWGAVGRAALVLRLDRVRPASAPGVAAEAAREAALRGVGLVAGPVDALADQGAEVVAALTRVDGGVVLYGRCPWDPRWHRAVPLVMAAAPSAADELGAHWGRALDGATMARGVDPVAATAQFRLTPEQVARAAQVARRQADLAGEAVDGSHLRAGARAHNNPGLDRLARRIEPAVGWGDLVLPGSVGEHLWDLAARARHRDTVLGRWGMRPGGGRGRGVVALFCGVSGTGKTMSAEVLAAELGMDLYAVNLATVVDKYIGETEKNLERIFTEAEGVSAVLLFDEADALFGKRSEVHDANDRYANIEVAYLLQEMERFDGLAVLSTNLRSNVDDAFVRRLDAIIEFPMPDAELRLALWERSLAPAVPRADDLDLAYLATTFELAGGSIRSVAVGAAYMAAEAGRPLSMDHLVRSLQREYRKLGRLCTEAEFGPYWSLVQG